MKRTVFSLLVPVCGLLCFGLPSSAQTTVFSDNFTSDSSLAQPPWYNLNNTSAAGYTFNADDDLALTVSSGTGKVNEMFAEFNSVTLGAGDYLTFTVDFTSPSGMQSDTGGLLAGVYNNATINSTNEQGSAGGSTTTGGETAASQGYFGIMGYNTTAGTSTKFFTRTGGASDENELGYYSEMTANSFNQLSAFSATTNAALLLNTKYTLQLTINDNGASGNTVTAKILDGATVLDNWVSTDTTGAGGTGLYETFNQLDFGAYGKINQVDMDMLDASITTDAPVPEPSAMALLGAGLGLIGFLRFRRR